MGRDVSDLDLPAPAKTKPWVRVCRHLRVEGKASLGIREQLLTAFHSIPLPLAEPGQHIPRESHFSQLWSPLGLKLSLECSLLMLAVRFPRKPPQRSLCRALTVQGCRDSPAHAALGWTAGWEQDRPALLHLEWSSPKAHPAEAHPFPATWGCFP